MFVRTWMQALRKVQPRGAIHSIIDYGVAGNQCRFLYDLRGPCCQNSLQSVLRGTSKEVREVSYFAHNLSTFRNLRTESNKDDSSQGLAKQEEDPFDPLTDRIPEKPVTVVEGASYGIVILAGLAVAGAATYAVFKELVFQPKEYKIFGKALERVQKDNQVTVRLGSPITGYGQESRNRAARQRISNRSWTDEDGVERCEVVFFIRGPQGSGKVHSEMFKDKADRTWKFTYLIVDVTNPYPTRLMLESYIPNMPAVNPA